MGKTFRVLSLNMHKGMNSLNSQLTIHRLAKLLGNHPQDLIFLQEVQGEHRHRAVAWHAWPEGSQDAYLADSLSLKTMYGGNAFYRHGHHGNALISGLPILSSRNVDISQNRLEQRGMLHCVYDIGAGVPLHALCVHLNLLGRDRKKQLHRMIDEIHHYVPSDAPLILAGDFNDWQNDASHLLLVHSGLKEAVESVSGRPGRTFPARWPMLSLDRIYVRHLSVTTAVVGDRQVWRGVSDHLPLMATLRLD